MSTTNYQKGEIVLIPFPFSDLSASKVRPAVVVGTSSEKYSSLFVIPLTSRIAQLEVSEFLIDWNKTGLNVPSAVKRGCFMVDQKLIIKKIGKLSEEDISKINNRLKTWFNL